MKKIIFVLFCYFFSVNTSKSSDYLYDLGAPTCISSGTGGKVKGVFGKQLPSLIPADLSMVLFTLNGKVITNDLTPGQITLIPQGLIHDQVSFNF